jgi:hypothetical protein
MVPETERGSTKSHPVEKSLWKRPRTWPKTAWWWNRKLRDPQRRLDALEKRPISYSEKFLCMQQFSLVVENIYRGIQCRVLRYMIYFVNCNWVVTRWQQYSTHLHTNNTQNDTKQTMHRTTQQFWKSAGRAPSWLVIPWHLPCNRGKSTEKPQSG